MKYVCYSGLFMAQLFCHSLYCQFYFSANNKIEPDWLWETGIAAGPVNCLTDIGGGRGTGKKFTGDINWGQTRFGGGVFISTSWQYVFAIRMEAITTKISGNDAVLKNSTGTARNRYLRNLQFCTNLTELSLSGELFPLTLVNRNRDIPLCSPYIIAGAGICHYNPRARLNNKWIELRPLHTEGEGFKEYSGRPTYRSVTWCIPMGAGIKYDAAGLVNLRFELLYRITGTDYLDDTSTTYIDPSLFSHYLSPAQTALAAQMADRSGTLVAGNANPAGVIRGNPKNKDAYFSAMIKASIVLGRLKHK